MSGLITAGIVGTPPLDLGATPSTTAQFSPGTVVTSSDPNHGGGRFIYAKCAAAQAVGALCAVSGAGTTPVMTAVANTANLGVPLFVARQTFTAADQYGWYQIDGLCPIVSNATVAVGSSLGITAAGTAGTLAAGKQILGVVVAASQTGTITKTGTTTNGSKQVTVGDVDGVWVGQAVTGTGIAGSSTVASIGGNNVINLNNAATATGTVTLTFTYTGFTLVRMTAPNAQGAIT